MTARKQHIHIYPKPESPFAAMLGDGCGCNCDCAAPYRETLALTELEQLTQKEAAARLGISPTAAKARVRRGREQLRAALLRCCEIQQDRRLAVIDVRQRQPCDCGCSSDDCCAEADAGVGLQLHNRTDPRNP